MRLRIKTNKPTTFVQALKDYHMRSMHKLNGSGMRSIHKLEGSGPTMSHGQNSR